MQFFTFLVNSIIFLVKLQLNTTLTRIYSHTFYHKALLGIFLICLFAYPLIAQNNLQLSKKEATSLVTTYLDSSWNNIYLNLDTAQAYNKRALVIAENFDLLENKAAVYSHMGIYFELKGNYDSAIYYHLAGIELLDALDTLPSNLINAYHNLSDCYKTFQNTSKALEAIEKSLQLARQFNRPEDIPYALFGIANIHFELLEYDLSIDYFQKVITYFPTDTTNNLRWYSYANIGKSYLNLNELDSAKKYFELYQYAASIKIGKTRYDDMHVARTLYEYNLSIGNYSISKEQLEKSFRLANHIGLQNEIATCLQHYSTYFETIGNMDSAFYYYKRYESLLDSIESSEVRGRIIEMETKYETAKKENKILELEGEAQVTKARNILLSAVSVLMGLIVVIIFLFYNSNRKKSKKLAEQNQIIQESYREIENLIRESHHRIKNNLQVVSSLLKMQSKNVQSEEAKASLVEAFNRVKTIALLHQKLQGSETFKSIRLNDFIQQLIDNIKLSLTSSETAHKIICKVEPIEVETDQSISIGLIVNELITNSVKYSNNGKASEVTVELIKLEKEYKLSVSDNGVGFPEDFDPEATRSLGFKIVKSLVTKLHGKLLIKNENGAVIQIIIPSKKIV
jgi:two-component sensor histidine kinase